MTASIHITGPRDRRYPSAATYIDTTSNGGRWSGLSPFVIGPCALYGGHVAIRMENAWQFSKCYAEHVAADGSPSPAYWMWARSGWSNPRAVRYPMGKGRRPSYSVWNGERLDYVAARKRIYAPIYSRAVRITESFRDLRRLYASGADLVLFDYDGYDHDAMGIPLERVIDDPRRKMGHAFVLKGMLIHGDDYWEVKP